MANINFDQILRGVQNVAQQVGKISTTAEDVIDATKSVLDVKTAIQDLTGTGHSRDEQSDAQRQVQVQADQIRALQEQTNTYKHTQYVVFAVMVVVGLALLLLGVLQLSSTSSRCKKQVAAYSLCVTFGSILVVASCWYGAGVAFV